MTINGIQNAGNNAAANVGGGLSVKEVLGKAWSLVKSAGQGIVNFFSFIGSGISSAVNYFLPSRNTPPKTNERQSEGMVFDRRNSEIEYDMTDRKTF